MPAKRTKTKTKRSESDLYRSLCPLAAALDLVGDKWSLVIVRDMTIKKRRYQDFQNSPERIPTNILANRLKTLERHGIIKRRRYQTRPVRYEYLLTRKGAELLPVLQQLALWGHKHIPGRWTPPEWFLRARPDDLETGPGLLPKANRQDTDKPQTTKENKP
jgi:DNA-binding HxlR family transcriptional regulator